jgi:hypothetical protein
VSWGVIDGSITNVHLASDVTLANVLVRGNTTGARDIRVSTGQQLIFEVGGDALGDIQSLGTLAVRTASTLDFTAATGNVGFVASAGNVNMSGVNQVNLTASAAGGFVRVTVGGTNRFWFTGTGALAIGAAADRGTLGELFISQGDTTPIWGQAITASYTDASVTLPKIATQAADTFLGNFTAGVASPTARAGTSVSGDGLTYTTGGTLSVTRPKVVTVNPKAGGTENAYVLPVTLLHGDILFWQISGAVTLNGIDSTGVIDGFEFTLLQANGGFPDGNQVTIVDESGSAIAANRFGTPDNISIVIGTGATAIIRYTSSRWTVLERGFPRASNSIAYGGLSGREVRRAALTGDVTASEDSNTTAIAPGVIVDADVNASAAIAQTKLGATTGFSVKASGSAATTSAEPLVMYTASGNTSAERVTTSSTSITVSTAVASQIAFQRAALTGDVTAGADSNATTIANDAVTTAKILNNNVTLAKIETLAARTVISNNTLVDATATEVPHTDIIIRPDLLDCFVGGVASTTLPNSALGWLYRNISGSGTLTRGTSGADGSYIVETGAAVGAASEFTLGDTATTAIITPTQFKYTEFRIDLSSTATMHFQIGFFQNSATATTGGTACCIFLFDSSVSANWQTITRTASVSTQKTSVIVANTSLTRLGIATDFSGPTIRFYVNDVLAATHTALENIPTTDMNVGLRIGTLSGVGTAKNVALSRFTAIRRLDGRSIPEV